MVYIYHNFNQIPHEEIVLLLRQICVDESWYLFICWCRLFDLVNNICLHTHTNAYTTRERERATHVVLFYLTGEVLRTFVTWRKLTVAQYVWEARRDTNVWQVLRLLTDWRGGGLFCCSCADIKETQVEHLISLSYLGSVQWCWINMIELFLIHLV